MPVEFVKDDWAVVVRRKFCDRAKTLPVFVISVHIALKFSAELCDVVCADAVFFTFRN